MVWAPILRRHDSLCKGSISHAHLRGMVMLILLRPMSGHANQFGTAQSGPAERRRHIIKRCRAAYSSLISRTISVASAVWLASGFRSLAALRKSSAT